MNNLIITIISILAMSTQLSNHRVEPIEKYNFSEVTRSNDDAVKKHITINHKNPAVVNIDKLLSIKPSAVDEAKKFKQVKKYTKLNECFTSNLMNYIN